MRFRDRLMLATKRSPGLRRASQWRKLRSRPKYVQLSTDAIRVIEDLARETKTTPAEVLTNSVTLYKLALDSRKEAKRSSVLPSS